MVQSRGSGRQGRRESSGTSETACTSPHERAGNSAHQVERVLASPVETIQVRFGRLAAFGNINGRQLLVVYETRNGEKEVIITFWTTPEGLRRYGFLRI